MQFFVPFIWAAMTVFCVVRAARMWTRGQAYFDQTWIQMSLVFPVKKDFRRGMARGWTPFAGAMVAMTVALPLLIAGSPTVRTAGGGPSVLMLAGLAALLAWAAGMVLHLTVAWFNQPKWCVPPYLRDESGAWQLRRQARAHASHVLVVRMNDHVREEMQMARRREKFEQEPGERVVRKGGASHFRDPEIVGGRLLLTDRRIVFVPHFLNISRDVYAAPISEIREAGKGSGGPNRIEVQMIDDSRQTFLVFRPKTWLTQIQKVTCLQGGYR